jgi:hypothetical protein
MKKITASKVILLVVLIFALFVTFFVSFFSSGWVEKGARSLLEKSCESCKVVVRDTHLSWLQGTLRLRGVRFTWGESHATAVEADVESIDVLFAISDLWSKRVHLKNVSLNGLSVLVTEGDLKLKPDKSMGEAVSPWTFQIDQVLVSNGIFAYLREYSPKSAILRVGNIEGRIGAMGNSSSLLAASTHAEATGRLEKSGNFKLTLDSALFRQVVNLKVVLKLFDQNLSDIDDFFHSMAQIRIQGRLATGESQIDILGSQLTGWVKVLYRDLGITFESGRSRSGLTALLSNFVQTFSLRTTNLKERPKDQISKVSNLRKKDETFMIFILNGMKDGALGVATN